MYDQFAIIYDRVMRGVDYVTWADYILNLTMKYSIRSQRICDLACGTGSLAMLLAQKGCKVLGVDQSAPMLQQAEAKARRSKLQGLTWKQGDLTRLDLGEKFPLITCLYDSLNYLLKEEEVQACFQGVSRHLEPGGGFIFDVTTEYNIISNFADYTFAENFEDFSYIWENDYDINTRIISSEVTLFQKDGDRFFKHSETHRQKIYSLSQLETMLKEAGFLILGAFDGFTLDAPGPRVERVHFVCKK